MSTLGDRIRKLRNEKNLTQEEMASLLKVNRATLANWEINRASPDPIMLRSLADFFGTSVDYLLCRTDIRETPEQVIESAISDDPELLEFWQELVKREDLQLLFKQVKPLTPLSIKKIIKVIKAIEDAEAMEE